MAILVYLGVGRTTGLPGPGLNQIYTVLSCAVWCERVNCQCRIYDGPVRCACVRAHQTHSILNRWSAARISHHSTAVESDKSDVDWKFVFLLLFFFSVKKRYRAGHWWICETAREDAVWIIDGRDLRWSICARCQHTTNPQYMQQFTHFDPGGINLSTCLSSILVQLWDDKYRIPLHTHIVQLIRQFFFLCLEHVERSAKINRRGIMFALFIDVRRAEGMQHCCPHHVPSELNKPRGDD